MSKSLTILIDALALPADSRTDRRVPKKLLIEQGAATAADKRQIQNGIEEIIWIAALKPTNIGVPAFKDEVREYLEIDVLAASLSTNARSARLTELIHRAIPYPVVLLTEQDAVSSVSLAHKRWSHGETGEVVVEEIWRASPFQASSPTKIEAAFLDSLALSELPAQNLFALYRGWADRLVALAAARITGTYFLPSSVDRTLVVRESLDSHDRLQREIAALRAQAEKERQVNRLVELNLEINRLSTKLCSITSLLQPAQRS